MTRIASLRRALVLLGLLAAASWLAATRAPAGGNGNPLTQPGSTAFGKSFEEWCVIQSQFVIEENLAGGSEIGETIGRVRLLPGVTAAGSYEFDIDVPPGTPLVVAPYFIFGETYDDPDVRDDLPQDVIDFMLFETAQIQTELDGRVLLKGFGDELERFMFGPTYFDEPILYAEPQFRFENEDGEPVNALGAVFVVGIGNIYRPLPPGEHTLINRMSSPFFGDFEFTYHITVAPQ